MGVQISLLLYNMQSSVHTVGGSPNAQGLMQIKNSDIVCFVYMLTFWCDSEYSV